MTDKLSETYPAKSTRCSLERRTVAEPAERDVMWIVKIQWERVDAWFIGVYTYSYQRSMYLTSSFLQKLIGF